MRIDQCDGMVHIIWFTKPRQKYNRNYIGEITKEDKYIDYPPLQSSYPVDANMERDSAN